MNAQSITVFPELEAEIIWQWFEAMPVYMKRQMQRQRQTKDKLLADFTKDLNILVYDDSLLGFVNCQPHGKGFFDVHLFCPRRVSTEKLAEAVHTFFEHAKIMPAIKTLLFSVRQNQVRLAKCLADEGCVFTGWSYREQGQHFNCLIFENRVIFS